MGVEDSALTVPDTPALDDPRPSVRGTNAGGRRVAGCFGRQQLTNAAYAEEAK